MKRTAFAVLAVMLMAGCPKPNKAPDTPAVPIGPSTVVKDSLTMFWASAADIDGDSVCIRFRWGDGNLSDWSQYVASEESVSMSHAWVAVGACSVQAQAMDQKDLASEWSAAHVAQVVEWHAPDAPSAPSGPSTVLKDSTAGFSSTATDQDGDSVCVRFDWGDGDTSDWGQHVASGESVSMTHSWSTVGVCSLRAQAKDQKSLVSAWSAACVVNIRENHAPDAPLVPSGPSTAVRDSLATFWASAADVDGDSVRIRFDWGDGDTSDWSQYVAPGESVSTTHAWAGAGSCSVRAQAKDEWDAMSPWSSPRALFVASFPPGVLGWRYTTGGYVNLLPAVGDDGVLYFGCVDGCVRAVGVAGSLVWSRSLGSLTGTAVAIAPDKTLYIGSVDRCLHALGPDGTVKWSYPAGAEIYSSPAVGQDGRVYFGSDDSYVYALNADGSLVWRYATGERVRSSPAIGSDGTVYVGSHDRHLYAIGADGGLKWRYTAPGAVCSSPAIGADGAIYVGSDDGTLHAVNPDGTGKWTYNIVGALGWGGPVVGADGTIYCGSYGGYLYAVSPSGSLVWSYRTGTDAGMSTPVVAADGTVYFTPHDGTLYAMNNDGTLQWKYVTAGREQSSAALGPDGTVYFGSDENCLYAIGGTAPLAATPWPKFHYDPKNTGRVGGGQR